MVDEWWMMNDEWWMIDDWKLKIDDDFTIAWQLCDNFMNHNNIMIDDKIYYMWKIIDDDLWFMIDDWWLTIDDWRLCVNLLYVWNNCDW